MLLISREKRLIAEQQDRIPEMRVERSDQVLGVRHLEVMTPEQSAQGLDEKAFAGAALAAYDHSDFAGGIGMLDGARHPPDQVAVVLLIPTTEIVAKVEQERFVELPRQRIDGE